LLKGVTLFTISQNIADPIKMISAPTMKVFSIEFAIVAIWSMNNIHKYPKKAFRMMDKANSFDFNIISPF